MNNLDSIKTIIRPIMELDDTMFRKSIILIRDFGDRYGMYCTTYDQEDSRFLSMNNVTHFVDLTTLTTKELANGLALDLLENISLNKDGNIDKTAALDRLIEKQSEL